MTPVSLRDNYFCLTVIASVCTRCRRCRR